MHPDIVLEAKKASKNPEGPVIAVTGHRPDKLGREYGYGGPYSKYIAQELKKVVDEHNPSVLVSGMALGVDTIWAFIALKAGIPLVAAIPCRGHASKWFDSSVKIYNRVIEDPLTFVHLVTDAPYSAECMQVRNAWMVDNCDILAAVWNGEPGGTANCVRYANKVGREMVRIYPDAWRPDWDPHS